MIRVNKNSSAIPEILSSKGLAQTVLLKAEFNNGTTHFDFDSKIYGNAKVKNELIKLQHGKCCFCESEVVSVAYGDVEHFRPKGGWIQNNEQLNVPGYYWLAYHWDNLLLSCQICNQQYKKNYFPLITETTRALNHNYDIKVEDALFIDPTNENPEEYIEFEKNIPKSINNNIRGEVTIKKMGLNRDVLNEKRLKTLNLVEMLCNVAKKLPGTSDEVAEVKEYIIDIQKDTGKYASMLRCYFRKNPINF